MKLNKIVSSLAMLSLVGAALLVGAPALAEEHEHGHGTAQGQEGAHEGVQAVEHAADQAAHSAEEAAGAEHGEHGAHGEGAHGGGHHEPHFSDINWFTGLIGEKEGVEPSVLWRAPGTPVPLGALLINSFILFFLLVKLGGPAIQKGLLERKKRVVSGIEAAAAMKDEASGQLAHYEEKLQKIDQEIEHIKNQMREQAESERQRILSEAKVRREQLEADARLLVSQEMKLAREELFREVVAQAVSSAEESIKKQMGAADQQRLADEFLSGLDVALRGAGRASVETRS